MSSDKRFLFWRPKLVFILWFTLICTWMPRCRGSVGLMSATVSGLAQAWRSPQFRQRQAEPHPPCHRRQAAARQHGQSSAGGSRGLLGDSHIIPNNIAASMMPDQVAEQDSSSQSSSQKGRSASCAQTVGIPASVIAPANGLRSLANPSYAWISTEKAWYLPTETFPLSILSRTWRSSGSTPAIVDIAASAAIISGRPKP
ncbi:conserved hypothetical protein [Coccidioides posadasii str. Silveira]|uniref:Uncharacterized protein n=1 Tax=Coccidioides posadasii (strain RMSCC 757 / Silveira) TaxID=443226 RepID=E9CUK9_COCPS|nr:conserved hypothetical protein [Coccidioides posadasii str. Silveira]